MKKTKYLFLLLAGISTLMGCNQNSSNEVASSISKTSTISSSQELKTTKSLRVDISNLKVKYKVDEKFTTSGLKVYLVSETNKIITEEETTNYSLSLLEGTKLVDSYLAGKKQNNIVVKVTSKEENVLGTEFTITLLKETFELKVDETNLIKEYFVDEILDLSKFNVTKVNYLGDDKTETKLESSQFQVLLDDKLLEQNYSFSSKDTSSKHKVTIAVDDPNYPTFDFEISVYEKYSITLKNNQDLNINFYSLVNNQEVSIDLNKLKADQDVYFTVTDGQTDGNFAINDASQITIQKESYGSFINDPEAPNITKVENKENTFTFKMPNKNIALKFSPRQLDLYKGKEFVGAFKATNLANNDGTNSDIKISEDGSIVSNNEQLTINKVDETKKLITGKINKDGKPFKAFYENDYLLLNYSIDNQPFYLLAFKGDKKIVVNNLYATSNRYYLVQASLESENHFVWFLYDVWNNEFVTEVTVDLNTLKDGDDNTIIKVSKDSLDKYFKVNNDKSLNLVTKGKEANTYTKTGADDLILNGFGRYTLGNEEGKYTISNTTVTLTKKDNSTVSYNLDLDNKTYAEQEAISDPFETSQNVTYKGMYKGSEFKIEFMVGNASKVTYDYLGESMFSGTKKYTYDKTNKTLKVTTRENSFYNNVTFVFNVSADFSKLTQKGSVTAGEDMMIFSNIVLTKN